MNKKRSLIFSIVRGAMAIGIALLVRNNLSLLIQRRQFGARLLATLSSLKAMLIQPIFRANGTFSVKGFTDVLASMIPIIFTGLATCVMFSQTNLTWL